MINTGTEVKEIPNAHQLIAGERLKALTIYREFLPESEVLDHEIDLAELEWWVHAGNPTKARITYTRLTGRLSMWRERRRRFVEKIND